MMVFSNEAGEPEDGDHEAMKAYIADITYLLSTGIQSVLSASSNLEVQFRDKKTGDIVEGPRHNYAELHEIED